MAIKLFSQYIYCNFFFLLFNKMFSSTQRSVYDETAFPLVESVMEGFNGEYMQSSSQNKLDPHLSLSSKLLFEERKGVCSFCTKIFIYNGFKKVKSWNYLETFFFFS